MKAFKKTKKGQCIVITGISGAGKTITTNRLIEFISNRAVADQIETILESFGNCETPQNHNSSRFIKLVKVSFYICFLLKMN